MVWKKNFKIILHRDVVGKNDFSYIDIESSGRVSTCFSKVLLSEKMKQMPVGKYELGFIFAKKRMILGARRRGIYFAISCYEIATYPCVKLHEGDTLEDLNTAKMHWEKIHRETYLAGRDGYDATLEIVDERNLNRIEFL